MTTYVQKKNRFWLERKDLKPERRRSESRLKTYPSSTDVRNWCDVVEDRRQHILELVVKDIGKVCYDTKRILLYKYIYYYFNMLTAMRCTCGFSNNFYNNWPCEATMVSHATRTI